MAIQLTAEDARERAQAHGHDDEGDPPGEKGKPGGKKRHGDELAGGRPGIADAGGQPAVLVEDLGERQIGRASCRERV